jgi:hypothetical protein
MDPFSITIGSLALFGALKKSSNSALVAIQTLRKVPYELKRLRSEINRFAKLLEIVDRVGAGIQQQGPAWHHAMQLGQDLTTLIEEGNAIMASLEDLVKDIAPPSTNQELGRRQRLRWLSKKGKAIVLEDQIRALKQEINFRLNILTL